MDAVAENEVAEYAVDSELESREGTARSGLEDQLGEDRGYETPEHETPEPRSADPETTQMSVPDLAASLEPIQATMAQGFADLLRAFEDKLAYDRSKERQIDRLHAELQEHKRDLVAKIKRPLIQGLVRLHDDLGKVVTALGRRPVEQLTPERFFGAFGGFADDIELLLGQHGIEAYSAPGEDFDPRLQTALRTEATDDADLVGTIAERLRSGFSEGETLLQKERVAVYAATRSAPPIAADASASLDEREISQRTNNPWSET